jgi:RNA polymerase primary sigma factor
MIEYKEKNEKGVKKYFDSLAHVKPLTKEEEHKLFYRYKVNGDLAARNKIIQSNLRFAAKIAGNFRWSGIPYSELIGYANDGLIDSIDKFDINMDVKFFSYAKWGIIAKVEKAIRDEQRLPKTELPTDHETNSLTEDAMDTSICNIENIQDEFIYNAENTNEEIEEKKMVDMFLSILNEREQKMLCMYYGVDEEKSYNLYEIGVKFHISKERVRQIIEGAIRKIRTTEAILVERARLI